MRFPVKLVAAVAAAASSIGLFAPAAMAAPVAHRPLGVGAAVVDCVDEDQAGQIDGDNLVVLTSLAENVTEQIPEETAMLKYTNSALSDGSVNVDVIPASDSSTNRSTRAAQTIDPGEFTPIKLDRINAANSVRVASSDVSD